MTDSLSEDIDQLMFLFEAGERPITRHDLQRWHRMARGMEEHLDAFARINQQLSQLLASRPEDTDSNA